MTPVPGRSRSDRHPAPGPSGRESAEVHRLEDAVGARLVDGLVDRATDRLLDAEVFASVVERTVRRASARLDAMVDAIVAEAASRVASKAAGRLYDAEAIADRIAGTIDPGSGAVRRVAVAVCERIEETIRTLALSTLDDPERAADAIRDGIPDDHAAFLPVADRLRVARAPTSLAYGVVDAASWAREGLTWTGGRVRPVAGRRLVALVSDGSGCEDAREAVRRHAGLLDRVARHVGVVPLPLGSSFGSDDEIRAFLDLRESHFMDLLHRLAGSDEWTVRVVRDEGRMREHVGSGTEADERVQRLTEGCVRLVQRVLGGLAERDAGRWNAADDPATVLSLAYLVRRDGVGAFRAAFERLSTDCGPVGLELEFAGPWPPYHFVPATLVR